MKLQEMRHNITGQGKHREYVRSYLLAQLGCVAFQSCFVAVMSDYKRCCNYS